MMTLTPAYGRDYRSKKAVLTDFDENKDFIINDLTSRWDGKPVSKDQLKGGDQISFRYSKLTKVFVHTV